MFKQPIFETLPIAVIAASILLILLLHSFVAVIAGCLLIAAACYVLYRRLNEIGTDPDVMDYTDNAKHHL